MNYRVYYRSSGKIEFQVRMLAGKVGITTMRRVTIGSSSFTATAEQVVVLQDRLTTLGIENHVIAEADYRALPQLPAASFGLRSHSSGASQDGFTAAAADGRTKRRH